MFQSWKLNSVLCDPEEMARAQPHLYICFLYKSYWNAEIASASQMTGELEEKIKYM